jgi:hypothetical protein
MSEVTASKPPSQIFARRAERTPFSKQTAIRLTDGNSEQARVVVLIEDFSPFGIGLTCDLFIERGRQFTMQLAPSSGPAAELLYSVAYCQPIPNGKFRIGAEFMCIAGQDEVPTTAPKPEAESSMDRIRAAILG